MKRLILALGVFALGCSYAERHLPFLDLHGSRLVTPSGPVPFEMADDWRNPGFVSNQNLAVRAQAPDLGVMVLLFRGLPQVFVRNMRRTLTIEVAEGTSWYRLNAGPEIPLTLTRETGSVGASKRPMSLYFDLPAPLSRYDITVTGGTLESSSVGQIRAAEGDTHHLHLAFTADGEPYAVSLTFSVGVRSVNELAAPGGP